MTHLHRPAQVYLPRKQISFDQETLFSMPNFRSDLGFVKESCEKSLKHFGIDKIDLYLAHRVDGKTLIEKTVEVMTELNREGKINYLRL